MGIFCGQNELDPVRTVLSADALVGEHFALYGGEVACVPVATVTLEPATDRRQQEVTIRVCLEVKDKDTAHDPSVDQC